jgi:molybdopterin adenylyltransferase
MIRAAVLTVSDSSFAGTREDRSGPALAARLREIADSGAANFVIATGGTGVAARDVTPEAVRDVLHKEIPGLGEQMRAEGLKATPLASLSRSLGATRAQTLIVCVPGSPKGALESLNAIVKLVPHIVDLLEGRTGH